jgi:hypothetical protein
MAWIKVINHILTMQIQEWDNVMNEYSIKRIMKVYFFWWYINWTAGKLKVNMD